MPRWVTAIAIVFMCGSSVGCSCDDEGDLGERDAGGSGLDASPNDGGGDGDDGGATDMDGSVDPDGGDSGAIVVVDGGFLLPDGAVVECLPALCQGRAYRCGNCLDDDNDGLVDSEDPDCLGPCDNSEDKLNLEIPGIGNTCNRDCYFDQDSGNGNDMCDYNLQCDPLSPGERPSGSSCEYNPNLTCEETPNATCLAVCGRLVPNGCDCYGCCDIPGGSGNYVFIGSVPEPGQPACTIENAGNPGSCRPCTPNMECFNDCGRCELCLGRDPATIPADCFPPPPSDAGVPLDDAGRPIDAGPPQDAGPRDAGVPTDAGPPPPSRCPPNQQACGLPGDPACPAGNYCLTGCCIFFG